MTANPQPTPSGAKPTAAGTAKPLAPEAKKHAATLYDHGKTEHARKKRNGRPIGNLTGQWTHVRDGVEAKPATATAFSRQGITPAFLDGQASLVARLASAATLVKQSPQRQLTREETALVAAAWSFLMDFHRAVRTVASGAEREDALDDLGIGQDWNPAVVTDVVAAIEKFLTKAPAWPALIAEAGIQSFNLDDLTSKRDAIAPLAPTARARGAARKSDVDERDILALAVEQGYQRISAPVPFVFPGNKAAQEGFRLLLPARSVKLTAGKKKKAKKPGAAGDGTAPKGGRRGRGKKGTGGEGAGGTSAGSGQTPA